MLLVPEGPIERSQVRSSKFVVVKSPVVRYRLVALSKFEAPAQHLFTGAARVLHVPAKAVTSYGVESVYK